MYLIMLLERQSYGVVGGNRKREGERCSVHWFTSLSEIVKEDDKRKIKNNHIDITTSVLFHADVTKSWK